MMILLFYGLIPAAITAKTLSDSFITIPIGKIPKQDNSCSLLSISTASVALTLKEQLWLYGSCYIEIGRTPLVTVVAIHISDLCMSFILQNGVTPPYCQHFE